MFGKVEKTPQNEDTKFHPRSTYGISKLAAYEITRNYRESYDMFACSGILFNHESPRRGSEFVTRKISIAVAKIKLGLEKTLKLGNIDAERDWGYAKDYVEVMYKMLQNNKPVDYVIGTDKAHSVKDFLKLAFDCFNLNFEDYIKIDKNLFRPADVDLLVSDSSKAKKEINWSNKTSFSLLGESSSSKALLITSSVSLIDLSSDINL